MGQGAGCRAEGRGRRVQGAGQKVEGGDRREQGAGRRAILFQATPALSRQKWPGSQLSRDKWPRCDTGFHNLRKQGS
jgi:hypothetical protein